MSHDTKPDKPQKPADNATCSVCHQKVQVRCLDKSGDLKDEGNYQPYYHLHPAGGGACDGSYKPPRYLKWEEPESWDGTDGMPPTFQGTDYMAHEDE